MDDATISGVTPDCKLLVFETYTSYWSEFLKYTVLALNAMKDVNNNKFINDPRMEVDNGVAKPFKNNKRGNYGKDDYNSRAFSTSRRHNRQFHVEEIFPDKNDMFLYI